MERYDIAIIGAGPAGISAAINAKIRRKSFILLGSDTVSHKVGVSKEINNYPGIPSVSGEELNRLLTAHAGSMGITVTKETVNGIYDMGGYFALLAGQQSFEARSVIIATGSENIKPVSGEKELLGRGVSYCATCDGGLYKGKTIAVFCDIPESEEETEYLAGLAAKVYYFPNFKSKLKAENVVMPEGRIAAVTGTDKVDGIELKNGDRIEVDGVFFIKQAVAADVLLSGLETENGVIAVDRRMRTNIDGCFAAGDCTGAPYQIAKAVGEGNVALHSALSYLANTEN